MYIVLDKSAAASDNDVLLSMSLTYAHSTTAKSIPLYDPNVYNSLFFFSTLAMLWHLIRCHIIIIYLYLLLNH